ncbi:hypothetical protein AAZX31_07G135000 [Glycine max]|uniref:3'-5' exonuclease domain-containing protein n=2 Tax=Glycine subgen. Soja TaxID=1462606 RepID=I1KK93_SOYBN|nr:Werner Syndrome-like exonuclease [Glycine max]XP_028242136.1 Werner Syndrome-like exonuclease [Glycine soja]KAG5022636.1 hypothetical protein JHK85_018978 [Glycine max]KAG5037734.1 hypothetical protein JHK86_018574 [Glycine max]KAH1086839.1 hypothetical protein GYH30_018392 [Glycine max]KAH1241970.1 Werner Syndrome-like exonuclease [Glycine max]KRH49260.1 hypothetical protein GLYMA_07G143700v4 [Glycine max]|eukprot:XP_003530248.1 Werner Syndrome-like exonuclease [Glycine max]
MITTAILIEENGTGTNNYKRYEVTMGNYTIQTLVTASPSQVGSWLSSNIRNNADDLMIVGLDVEWKPNTRPNMQPPNPVATLQLCIGHNCLIFQILYAPLIPRALSSFLNNPDVIFVGVGIQEDADKLLRDYNLRVTNVGELRSLAAEELQVFQLQWAGLAALGHYVLGFEIDKPENVTMSRWDNRYLTDEQVAYAAIDAFVSGEIGRALID